VLETVRSFHAGGKIVAAVCAGPLVLQDAGILDGCDATCHPAVAAQLTGARRLDEPVVWAGRVATSQGPGTCFAFALDLVRHAEGADAASRLANAMVLEHPRKMS
jgi:4-methyl-5(b-hydroxyethyl)-thiazole monophosphate biosynthesis